MSAPQIVASILGGLVVLIAVGVVIACCVSGGRRRVEGDALAREAAHSGEIDELLEQLGLVEEEANQNAVAAAYGVEAARRWQKRARDAERCLTLVLDDQIARERRRNIAMGVACAAAGFDHEMKRLGTILADWGKDGRFH